MRLIAFLAFLVVPVTAFATDPCRYIEKADHFEVVCVGNPAVPTSNVSADKDEIPVVRGKHRPQSRYMSAARESRLKVIAEQRQKDTESPVMAGQQPSAR